LNETQFGEFPLLILGSFPEFFFRGLCYFCSVSFACCATCPCQRILEGKRKGREKKTHTSYNPTTRTDGAPEPVGVLKAVSRAKIRHCRQLYLNRPDPIAFLPVTVDTSDRLLFLHTHREASALTNELNRGSDDLITAE
jgi:hypothetical protein